MAVDRNRRRVNKLNAAKFKTDREATIHAFGVLSFEVFMVIGNCSGDTGRKFHTTKRPVAKMDNIGLLWMRVMVNCSSSIQDNGLSMTEAGLHGDPTFVKIDTLCEGGVFVSRLL